MGGSTLPFETAEKKYGTIGEDEVYDALINELPEAHVFRSVCLDKHHAKGEIDFLIVYKRKAFIIELKCWKGTVFQDGDKFFKEKESYEDTFLKEMSNPIKQIKRNTYQLKQLFHHVWFENALLFIDSDEVVISDNIPWFTNIVDLAKYIKNNGKENHESDINYLLNNIICYDSIYSSSFWGGKAKNCIIEEKSLCFNINDGIIKKNNIKTIKVNHNFTYDKLIITLRDNSIFAVMIDNGKILYRDNDNLYEVSISKVDYIKINS